MDKLIRIGKVTRLHGFKGELSLKVDSNFMASLEEAEMVFVEIDLKNVPFFMDYVHFTKAGFALVKFDGVDSEEDAIRLRNCPIFLQEEALDQEEKAEMESNQLEGYRVIDEVHGDLGRVSELVIHPGNSFIIVDRGEGEIIIPYHEDIVSEVDDEKQVITCRTPEGLIDLNL